MSTIGVVNFLRKVPPDVIERKVASANNRLVGGSPKFQQLESITSILQGKDVLVNLPTGY